jgi:hypothetical protein
MKGDSPKEPLKPMSTTPKKYTQFVGRLPRIPGDLPEVISPKKAGGARPGAGRPRRTVPIVQILLKITATQADRLYAAGLKGSPRGMSALVGAFANTLPPAPPRPVPKGKARPTPIIEDI